jgi:amidase
MVKEFGTRWSKAESDGQMLARVDGWENGREYMDKKGVQRVTETILFSGKIASEDKYSRALTDQTEFKARLFKVFEKVDFIVLPTLHSAPLKKPLLGSNVGFEMRVLGLQETEPMNLVGNPALVVPVPLKERSVPVTGLQLVGRNRSEADLLNAGRLIEATVGTAPRPRSKLSQLLHLKSAS